jgi:hypothetical protein
MTISIETLLAFVILSTIITLATDQIKSLLAPYFNIEKYALTVAMILSMAVIFTFYYGMGEALSVPIAGITLGFFQYVDLFLSGMILSGGAVMVHKLIDTITETLKK